MPTLKGTQTEKNILTAFAGESQARNRYTYFAAQAKKDGFVQISAIFEETANQEKEHAKRLYKLLEGGEVQVSASFPAGIIGTTLENLLEGAAGENFEHTTMYPEFAQKAMEEGFKKYCRHIYGHRSSGKAAREKVQGPGSQHRSRPGFQTGIKSNLEVPQLRLPA